MLWPSECRRGRLSPTTVALAVVGLLALGAGLWPNGATAGQASDPSITAIQPQMGPPGSTGTLTGEQFGTAPGAVKFTPDGGAEMGWEVLDWSETQIAFRLPAATPFGTGQVRVTRSDGAGSNTVAFEVTTYWIVHVDDDNTSGVEDGSALHPFDTIEEGMAAASQGDVVLAHPGLYQPTGLIMKSGVTLRGSGIYQTTVEGNAAEPALLLSSDVAYTRKTAVTDLTLIRGLCGIRLRPQAGTTSYATLERVVVSTADTHGVEFDSSDGASGRFELTARETRVVNHGADGVCIAAAANLTLAECELAHNTDAGLRADTGHTVEAHLTDTQVHHNLAEGIRGHSTSNIRFYTTRCRVHHNNADGIYISSYWNQRIYLVSEDCEWVDNGGSGVRLWCSTNDAEANATLTGDVMSRNGGHGFHADGPDYPKQILVADIRGSTAAGNAGYGLYGWAGFGTRARFTWGNVLLVNNGAGGAHVGADGVSGDATIGPATIAGNGPIGVSRGGGSIQLVIVNSIIIGHDDDLFGIEAEEVHYSNISDGTYAGLNGNILADPRFADPAAGDYHLKSTGGRYDPATKLWVIDDEHSPCIDAGDPTAPFLNEPVPNGSRINMGAHAGTAQASKSAALFPPGLLTVDTQVMMGGALNLNGPAPGSLGIVAIEPNGNVPETLYAIQVGPSPTGGWLRFVAAGGRTDAWPDGADAEWHTAAEWAGKRLRGLAPDTEHTFQAKAKLGGTETALVEVGAYSTNCACDVNRSGLATALDYACIRLAILTGSVIGVDQPWACDLNDDARVNVQDLSLARARILNP